jgi:hypothetical protein
MQRVTVADVEEMLKTMDGISHQCGFWLDDEAMVTQRVRENILRAMTVSANGVRRGWAMLHDGERIIVVVKRAGPEPASLRAEIKFGHNCVSLSVFAYCLTSKILSYLIVHYDFPGCFVQWKWYCNCVRQRSNHWRISRGYG